MILGISRIFRNCFERQKKKMILENLVLRENDRNFFFSHFCIELYDNFSSNANIVGHKLTWR